MMDKLQEALRKSNQAILNAFAATKYIGLITVEGDWDPEDRVMVRSYRTSEEARQSLEMLVAYCPSALVEYRGGPRGWAITVPLQKLEEAQRIIQRERIP